MPVPTFTTFNQFKEEICAKSHNLKTDTLKWMLTNSAVTTAGTVKADYTDLATANGYTAGGATWGSVTSEQTSGILYLIGADVTWTAAGGSIGPARYAVLYNDTSTGDMLIGYFDLGYSVTVADTQVLTLDINPTLGIWYF